MSRNVKLKEVKLTSLKFANWRSPPETGPGPGVPPPEGQAPLPPNPPAPPPIAPLAGPGNPNPNLLPFDFFRRQDAIERLANDKPGGELAGDATVWRLYLEEAAEHDEELVKGRHQSLDMLLLFAALFSAILTAFLIESKNLLELDPADESVALLKMIAESQRRVELGLPAQDFNVGSADAFTPSHISRWINGIWFASLALSLSAALVAMLGKEWLTAYLTRRPRPPRSHALVRQSRLEGLERWWALHIIAFLPSLLHLSLLLFSIGLIIYLSTLDTAIAAVIAALVGFTSLFYVITAIQGAIYDYCPFVTQISEYLKIIGAIFLKRPNRDPDAHGSTPSLKDMQALLWLANNARDPAVVECSFQALAGLHVPTTRSDADTDALPMQLDQQTTLTSLFDTVCKRVDRLLQNPAELATAGGANIMSRYTLAISKLAACLEKHYAGRSQGKEAAEIQARMDASRGDVGHSPIRLPDSVVTRPLDIIERLWSPESPAFPADVYAAFLTSEFTMLQVAAESGANVESMHELPSAGPNSLFVDGSTAPNHIIDMVETESKVEFDNSQILNLQVRYRQTMARATAMLWVHSKSDAPMRYSMLKMLLEAMSAASKCDALNTDAPIYLQQPHPPVVVPLLNVAECRFEATDLNTGPLAGFISLMHMNVQAQNESSMQLRRSVLQAISHVAPVVLHQMLNVDLALVTSEFDLETWTHSHHLADFHGIGYTATRQMMILLRYLGPLILLNDKTEGFLLEAMRLINLTLLEDKEDKGGRFALWAHGQDLIPFLEFAGASEYNLQALSRHSIFYLIDMVRLRPMGLDASMVDTILPPSTFAPLLRMIGRSDTTDKATEELVEGIVRRMRPRDDFFAQNKVEWNHVPCLDYLYLFTHTDQGFSALVYVARLEQENYRHLAIDAIVQTAHLAADRDPELAVAPVQLDKSAVPGFLDAVSIIAKHCSGVSERNTMLLDFSQDAVDLVRAALSDPGCLPLVAAHPASHDLSSAIWAVGDVADAQNVLDQLDRLRNRSKRKNEGDSMFIDAEGGFVEDATYM